VQGDLHSAVSVYGSGGGEGWEREKYKRTYLGRELECVDLVQQDEHHTLLDATALEQVLTHMLILYNNIVQLAACCDLECGAFPMVFRFECEQGCNKALDLAGVKSWQWS
jgi:hypothetical protein